jgi:hypothetical protein
VSLDQLGLEVKRIELAARARAENQDDVLGLGFKVRGACAERFRGIDLGTDWRKFAIAGSQQSIAMQQHGQRNPTQSTSQVAKEITS